MNGITLLIRLLIVGKLHLKGGTLVFLNTDAGRTSIGEDGETPVQQSCWQGKLCGAFTKAVGSNFLLCYLFIVGVTQGDVDAFLPHSHIVRRRLLFPDDGCNMNGLTRTIDTTIGKQAGMLCMIVVVVKHIAPIGIDGWTIAVCGSIGKQLFSITLYFLNGSIGQRFTCTGIHCHLTFLFIRHGLRQETDTRDIIEL